MYDNNLQSQPKLHLYGGSAAVCFEGTTLNGGQPTLNIDVAPKPDGDDREFGKNRTLSFASSCNQFIVFSMDERKWRKLFDKQIAIL